ncbi:hypothetical protein OH77DRAFT_1021119 [Trametes cingulata]|nr:hypothetical protein OH77DRAFT_1021119 [Trametes cingulata]
MLVSESVRRAPHAQGLLRAVMRVRLPPHLRIGVSKPDEAECARRGGREGDPNTTATGTSMVPLPAPHVVRSVSQAMRPSKSPLSIVNYEDSGSTALEVRCAVPACSFVLADLAPTRLCGATARVYCQKHKSTLDEVRWRPLPPITSETFMLVARGTWSLLSRINIRNRLLDSSICSLRIYSCAAFVVSLFSRAMTACMDRHATRMDGRAFSARLEASSAY